MNDESALGICQPEVDERLQSLVHDIMQWGNRWWMWPFRRRLLSMVATLSVCAREAREQRIALDGIVDDGREEELRKFAQEQVKSQKRMQAVRDVDRDLARIVATHVGRQ